MAGAVAAPAAGGKKVKSKKSKTKRRLRVALALLALVALISWWATKPQRGGPVMALCRVFIETQIRYPQTLKLTTMDWYQDSTRMYYTYTGPFGENRSSMADCKFEMDPATNLVKFKSIKIDKMEIPNEKLDAFNKTIPLIMGYEMENILPRQFSGDLFDLKRD